MSLKNKKIGVLNFSYSNYNYGAVLQAAALHYVLSERFNYESEHINYILEPSKTSILGYINDLRKISLMAIGLKNKELVHRLFGNSKAFENFRARWLPRTSVEYLSIDELKSTKHEYMAIIVGSDQVWRTEYTANSALVYFLSFVPKEIKRISYAASFGKANWEASPALTAQVKEELKLFSSISVREDSGVHICNEVFNIDAEHVLDPTLLAGVDFFNTVIDAEKKSRKTQKNIVYYKLDIDNRFEDLLQFCSKKLDTKAENIYYETKVLSHSYYNIGDWLFSIKNATLVITDSFHCVCFAIIFSVPFIYYPNNHRGIERLESLFRMLDIDAPVFNTKTDVNSVFNKAMDVDFLKVNETLNHMRNKSESFLLNSLEN